LKAKTLAAYLKFLDDAVSYYETLVESLSVALDTAYSSSIIISKNDDISTTAADLVTPLQSSLRTSLARSYICIGDLRRYYAAAAVSNDDANNDKVKDALNGGEDEESVPGSSLYSSARQAYAAAVGVDPRFGNGYNQLAVVDELQGDPLTAAFFYLRAQCALTPFPLGHQNVALLFGAAVTAENTAHAANTSAAVAAAGHKKARKDYSFAKNTHQQQQQQQTLLQRGSMPTPLLEKEIISKYLALSGCLYEKVDVDATPHRLSSAGGLLDELLNRIKQQTGSGGVAKCARRVAQEFHSMPTSVHTAMEQRPVSLMMLLTAVPLLLIQIFDDSLLQTTTTSTSSIFSGNLTACAAARGYTISYLLDVTSRLLIAATKLRLTTKGPIGDAALSCPIFAAISVGLRWLVVRNAQPALTSSSNLGELPLVDLSSGAGANAAPNAAAAKEEKDGSSIVNTLRNVEKTVSGLNSSRTAFWKACTALTKIVPSTGILSVPLDGEEGEKILSSEDYLLTGFTPLLTSIFVTRGSEQSVEEKAEKAEKNCDVVAARALAAALASTITTSTINQWDDSDPGRPAMYRVRRIWQHLQSLASYARNWLLQINKNSAALKNDGELFELQQAVNEFLEAVSASGNGETSYQPINNATTTATEAILPEEHEDNNNNTNNEEEEEEDIVFAPLSATRRSNSAAALLSSGGNSGRSTPAPAAPAAENTNNFSPSPQIKNNQNQNQFNPPPPMAVMAMDVDATTNPAVAMHDTTMGEGNEEEDAQAAMERTGYAMAATVLSSDDVELQIRSGGGGAGGGGGVDYLLPPHAPAAQSSGLLGSNLMFGNVNTGYNDSNMHGGGGTNLLMSSWQQQHHMMPPQQQQQQQQQHAPPPFPSSALIGGVVGQHQEPAEGLRAVLFGGNNVQQQHQQPQSGTGGGGGLWG
jgi:hypothetical protein